MTDQGWAAKHNINNNNIIRDFGACTNIRLDVPIRVSRGRAFGNILRCTCLHVIVVYVARPSAINIGTLKIGRNEHEKKKKAPNTRTGPREDCAKSYLHGDNIVMRALSADFSYVNGCKIIIICSE